MSSQDEQQSSFLNETVKDAKQDESQFQVHNTGDPDLAEKRADQDDEDFKQKAAEEGTGGTEALGGVTKKVQDAAASVSMGF